jgi:hypothetical protein
MVPYPGTDSFLRLEKEGRVFCKDWEKYDSLNAVYQLLLMSVAELEISPTDKEMVRSSTMERYISSIHKKVLK